MKRWWFSEKNIEIASDETASAFRQRPQGESFVFQKINGCRGVRNHVRRSSTHRRHHAGDHDGCSVRFCRKPAVGQDKQLRIHRNAARKLATLVAREIAAKFGFWKGLRSIHRMIGMM